MTTPNPDGQIGQIFVELGKISVQLAHMEEALKAVPDHEARIRALEKWRYGLPLAGVTAAASIAISVYEAMRR